MDSTLELLRLHFLGCDIEHSFDPPGTTSPGPMTSFVHRGPIAAIDRRPDGAIVVTPLWIAETTPDMIWRAIKPKDFVIVGMPENPRIDGSGRLIIQSMNPVSILVFFPKSRGNMDAGRVIGIDPKFIVN